MHPVPKGVKTEPQFASFGQLPPHSGAPGSPQGVLPGGRQPQVPNPPGPPTDTHSSPGAHSPLQIGFSLSPHVAVRARRLASVQSLTCGGSVAPSFRALSRDGSFLLIIGPANTMQFRCVPIVIRTATR